MPTADWKGTRELVKSLSRKPWYARVVKRDGTVLVRGVSYVPHDDVRILPEVGEVLLFFDYGDGRSIHEWTAPADPDGCIRRSFWKPAALVEGS